MDRYAHLRENLATYRTMTAHAAAPAWCAGCEQHLADESGLCPVCRPVLVAPASQPASDDAA